MKFCHIAPTSLVPMAASMSTCHLTLAHLIEKDPDYIYFHNKAWDNLAESGVYPVKIMDNSGFEMYKEHGPGFVFEPSKLLECAKKVYADYVVMPDYPGEISSHTINAAKEWIPTLKERDLGTFYVPQGRPGDIEEWIGAFQWGLEEPGVDYIGISILAVPIAFGVESNNKLQRYLSRYKMMQLLEQRGILRRLAASSKQIHFLGMVDGPNEIELCSKWIVEGLIDSWDSSSATWAALMGKTYDESPTGLINGKFETPVDFDWKNEDIYPFALQKIIQNITYINNMVNKYHGTRKRMASTPTYGEITGISLVGR